MDAEGLGAGTGGGEISGKGEDAGEGGAGGVGVIIARSCCSSAEERSLRASRRSESWTSQWGGGSGDVGVEGVGCELVSAGIGGVDVRESREAPRVCWLWRGGGADCWERGSWGLASGYSM